MKIWYQSAVEMDGASAYSAALKQHFARVVPDVHVDLVGVDPGTWGGYQPSEMFRYPAIFQAALGDIFLRNVVSAERQGYDAFLIGTYIEPFLRELRSAVEIPVASSLEASLLLACSVGRTAGLLTLNEPLSRILVTNVERHRLSSRVGPILSMEPALNESDLTALFEAPGPYLESFVRRAEEAVRQGADVIVPAEGILAEIVGSNGIREVAGAPVIDGVGLPLAYAGMMVTLWRLTGLRTTRRWYYDRPASDVIDAFLSRHMHAAKTPPARQRPR